uniref:Putative secreted protein n=1 Tax=Anopheles marajoara TaxID=58244 RepID=A0A2M4C9N0_9DIPT
MLGCFKPVRFIIQLLLLSVRGFLFQFMKSVPMFSLIFLSNSVPPLSLPVFSRQLLELEAVLCALFSLFFDARSTLLSNNFPHVIFSCLSSHLA